MERQKDFKKMVDGKTQWISTPDCSCRISPVRLRAGDRNHQVFPLLIHEMGGTPNTAASTDRHKERQSLLLPRRDVTIRPRLMGP